MCGVHGKQQKYSRSQGLYRKSILLTFRNVPGKCPQRSKIFVTAISDILKIFSITVSLFTPMMSSAHKMVKHTLKILHLMLQDF